MLWLDVENEQLEPGDAGDALLAAFFVPGSPADLVPTVEEWAQRANVEKLRHKQLGSRPDDIFTRGLWGGEVSCEFYVARLEKHTCIMIGPFYRFIRDLVSYDEPPPTLELREPPTWPMVELFRKTCLSLGAEVMIFSYWPEHANLRFVREQYPLVLKRDPVALSMKQYGLLYLNGELMEEQSPWLIGAENRDHVEVEGGGLLVFAEKGPKRWVNI